MAQKKSKTGFIIESSTGGYFYHRLGYWVKYSSAADAFVWTEQEAATIVAASTNEKWEIHATTLHPAIYDTDSGITILTGASTPSGKAIPKPTKAVKVPLNNGKVLDLGKEISSILGTKSSYVGSGMSL
jgi:hypothetical protein